MLKLVIQKSSSLHGLFRELVFRKITFWSHFFLKGLKCVQNSVGYNHIKQQPVFASYFELRLSEFSICLFLWLIKAFKELDWFRFGPTTVLGLTPSGISETRF